MRTIQGIIASFAIIKTLTIYPEIVRKELLFIMVKLHSLPEFPLSLRLPKMA